MNEDAPFLNTDLTERTRSLELYLENERENYTVDLMEDLHLSELGRIFENADERDILVVLQIAVKRFPEDYAAVLLDYFLQQKGEKK